MICSALLGCVLDTIVWRGALLSLGGGAGFLRGSMAAVSGAAGVAGVAIEVAVRCAQELRVSATAEAKVVFHDHL